VQLAGIVRPGIQDTSRLHFTGSIQRDDTLGIGAMSGPRLIRYLRPVMLL